MQKELTDGELRKYELISRPLRQAKYDEAMERVKKAYEYGKSVDKAIEDIIVGVVKKILVKEDIIDYYKERELEKRRERLRKFKRRNNRRKRRNKTKYG